MRAPVTAAAVVLLGLACSLQAARADQPAREQSFEIANAAFADRRFDEARAILARLVEDGGASPAVLYNLGNAAFRAGRTGEAILAYERALQLAPRDQDVRANLRQVRKAAGLPEPESGPWMRLVHTLTVNGWAWLASAGLWITCLSLLARRLPPPSDTRGSARSPLRAPIAAGLALLLLGGATCAALLAERDRGVVLDQDPKLRVAPYASATVSSELPPGEIVRLERSHEGFTLVRTTAGRSGWMADGAVARIAR